MAWDSSRSVNWKRLTREWLIYVGIASAAMVIYYQASGKDLNAGIFAGLLASGPMYLLFGAGLAKFGYQRKTLRELRVEREAAGTARPGRATASATTASTPVARPKPAPTRRTSTGPSQHRKSNKPKRR